jgi:phosphatidylethanolamine-binding protein (PEBP) family uncharacterized protein
VVSAPSLCGMKVVVIETDAKGNIDIAAFRATPKKNALDACQRSVIDYIGPCPPTGTIHRYIWTIDAFRADFYCAVHSAAKVLPM